jgi:hypothetical protein
MKLSEVVHKLYCKVRDFFQDFGNMTHTHGIGKKNP